jgi:hypothetical protein
LVVVVSVVVTTVWMGYGVMLRWWSEVVVVPTKYSVKTVMWCYNLQDLWCGVVRTKWVLDYFWLTMGFLAWWRWWCDVAGIFGCW